MTALRHHAQTTIVLRPRIVITAQDVPPVHTTVTDPALLTAHPVTIPIDLAATHVGIARIAAHQDPHRAQYVLTYLFSRYDTLTLFCTYRTAKAHPT